MRQFWNWIRIRFFAYFLVLSICIITFLIDDRFQITLTQPIYAGLIGSTLSTLIIELTLIRSKERKEEIERRELIRNERRQANMEIYSSIKSLLISAESDIPRKAQGVMQATKTVYYIMKDAGHTMYENSILNIYQESRSITESYDKLKEAIEKKGRENG